MQFYDFEINNGSKNMQIDSELLDSAIQNKLFEPVFRLYGWSPKCISLGRNQREDFLNYQIDVVRRLTGGRALLHDDEVTYSCIFPIEYIRNGESIIESYKYISGILIDFFNTLGVTLEYGGNKKIETKFQYCMLLCTGADVCYNGKKLIGSAQYRKNGYILQHGSILFGYDKKLLQKLFNEEIKEITTVKEILPDITKDKFICLLKEYIVKRFS